ncbi:MAG: sporulation transcriptional regulator SpoIIID [Clostridia bacterium]|nr:sporulation transcriptional regulator SpoIIID [Clostridia bacterium]
MKSYIKERTLAVANYVSETGETVRKAAQHFGISKSTVHNDLHKRLAVLDKKLYAKVKKVLDTNFLEKHIRGGAATQRKFLNNKKIK